MRRLAWRPVGNGIDPTLGAILPLVGVIVGGALAGGWAYMLRRRDERNDLRASRVVLYDLGAAAITLGSAVEMKDWGRLEDESVNVSEAGWRANELVLARHLDDVERHDRPPQPQLARPLVVPSSRGARSQVPREGGHGRVGAAGDERPRALPPPLARPSPLRGRRDRCPNMSLKARSW